MFVLRLPQQSRESAPNQVTKQMLKLLSLKSACFETRRGNSIYVRQASGPDVLSRVGMGTRNKVEVEARLAKLSPADFRLSVSPDGRWVLCLFATDEFVALHLNASRQKVVARVKSHAKIDEWMPGLDADFCAIDNRGVVYVLKQGACTKWVGGSPAATLKADSLFANERGLLFARRELPGGDIVVWREQDGRKVGEGHLRYPVRDATFDSLISDDSGRWLYGSFHDRQFRKEGETRTGAVWHQGQPEPIFLVDRKTLRNIEVVGLHE